MSLPLKVIHTSDWHLGHSLHGHPRAYEHERFFDFLLDLLTAEEVDALVVAGDVFDTANPPASAQAAYFRFLAEARARRPALDVVVVAGNHDSPGRISAAGPILRSLGVRVVGAVRRLESDRRAVDLEPLIVPLHDRAGEVAAWVAAIPFTRAADLPSVDAAEAGGVDSIVAGLGRLYGLALDEARARRRAGQALIATGHCHMVDAKVSELSERRVFGGLASALPASIFPADVDYVALGHLHLAQAVGGIEHIRYSGSPIPLSMPEETYPHEVRLLRFEGGRLAAQEGVAVPRARDVLRLPASGPAPIEEVEALLAALDPPPASPEAWPFVEARVRVDRPVPDLCARLERALEGKPVVLSKVSVERPNGAGALAESAPRRELAELKPEEVFRLCYARTYPEDEPSEALLEAFHEVCELAAGEEAT